MILRVYFTLCALALFSFSSKSQTLSFNWAKSVGGTTQDAGHAIASDRNGNVYIGGVFKDVVDFNPGPGTNTLSSKGDNDFFIQKLDSSGTLVWAKSFGGKKDDYCYSIALDTAGFIYLVGSFKETVDFDPGPATFNLTAVGGQDIFIQKLDGAGNLVWAKSIGGSREDVANSIFTTNKTHIYISGNFQETVDFDPGPGFSLRTSSGMDDVFLMKMDTAGNLTWSTSFGGKQIDLGSSVTVDRDDNIYVVGSFRDTVDFDPGPGFHALWSNGADDIFIQKFNSSGIHSWTRSVGGIQTDIARSVVTDTFGSVYTTGAFRDTFDFDPGIGNRFLMSEGGFDVFVQKLDSSGDFLWAFSNGGSMDDLGSSMVIDSTFDIYFTGIFQGTVDFDHGPGTTNVSSVGSTDVFVQKITSKGAFEWVRAVGGISMDVGFSIATNAVNDLYFTGSFIDTVDFNPDAGVLELVSKSSSADIFIAKLSQCKVPKPDKAKLETLTATCSVSKPKAPTATSNCSGKVTGVPDVSFPVTTQGTTTITWTYDDGNGNTSTQQQTIFINDDVDPVIQNPNLPDLVDECSVAKPTAPKATDNCLGTINGVPDKSFPITSPDTTIVTWTYTDGNGNNVSQIQRVIINDKTVPVPDIGTLTKVTGECSIDKPTAPTATDNCAGSVTGTTDHSFPITAPGTSIVIWTYDDGRGNKAIQQQSFEVTPVDSTVTVSGSVLTANADGYDYQWLDCDNGNTPISGETGKSFTATKNGNYAVRISNAHCTVTSDCIEISHIGVDETLIDASLSVYPTIVSDLVFIRSNDDGRLGFEVINSSGERLITGETVKQHHSIDLTDYPAGIYVIHIWSWKKRLTKRVVKM